MRGHTIRDLGLNTDTGIPDPPSITNQVALWWANDLELADADPVSSWTDRLGGKVVSNTGTNRPTWMVNGINGLPSVDFESASSQYLFNTTSALFTGGTGVWVAVFQMESFPASTPSVWSSCHSGSLVRWVYCTTSSSQISVSQRNNDTAGTVNGSTDLVVDTAYCMEISANGGSYSARLNNVAEFTNQGNGDWYVNTSFLDRFAIGARVMSSVSGYMDGMLSFLFYASAPLSDPDRSSLYGWISTVYGL